MNINKILIYIIQVLLVVMLIIQIAIICELKGLFEFYNNDKKDLECIEVKTVANCYKTLETKEFFIDEKKYLGEFRLTAYCSCYYCCGSYALNRPVDEFGNEIVYGSIGETLIEGYSIAVDPDVIPYGTEVIIDGVTYKAQDCGGMIDGNEIDVYFSDHKKAEEFEVQYKDVYLKG